MGTDYTKQFIRYIGLDPETLPDLEISYLGWILERCYIEVAERTHPNIDLLFWLPEDKSHLSWTTLKRSGFGADELADIVYPYLFSVSSSEFLLSRNLVDKAYAYLSEHRLPGISSLRLDIMCGREM